MTEKIVCNANQEHHSTNLNTRIVHIQEIGTDGVILRQVSAVPNVVVHYPGSIAQKVKTVALVNVLTFVLDDRASRNSALSVDAGCPAFFVNICEEDLFELLVLFR